MNAKNAFFLIFAQFHILFSKSNRNLLNILLEIFESIWWFRSRSTSIWFFLERIWFLFQLESTICGIICERKKMNSLNFVKVWNPMLFISIYLYKFGFRIIFRHSHLENQTVYLQRANFMVQKNCLVIYIASNYALISSHVPHSILNHLICNTNRIKWEQKKSIYSDPRRTKSSATTSEMCR